MNQSNDDNPNETCEVCGNIIKYYIHGLKLCANCGLTYIKDQKEKDKITMPNPNPVYEGMKSIFKIFFSVLSPLVQAFTDAFSELSEKDQFYVAQFLKEFNKDWR